MTDALLDVHIAMAHGCTLGLIQYIRLDTTWFQSHAIHCSYNDRDICLLGTNAQGQNAKLN
jgi:hypothetical protein